MDTPTAPAAASSAPTPSAKGSASDEDDPVVAEYELWHSKDLFDALALFQFPLRSAGAGYNMQKLRRLQRQLHSQRYRIEFDPRQTPELRSDDDDGDGRESSADTTRTQPFAVTSARVRNKTNYAVGVVRGQRITLTGLQQVHQFRPDLVMNSALNPESHSLGRTEVEHESVIPAHIARQGSTAVHGQGQQPQTLADKTAKLRLSSFWEAQKEKEPWINLGFKTQEEIHSRHLVFAKLFCQEEGEVPFDPGQSTTSYIRRVWRMQAEPWMRRGIGSFKAPLSLLPVMPLQVVDQATSLIQCAQVLSYHRMRSKFYLSSSKADDSVIEAIESSAVLIRGLWFAKLVPGITGLYALAREWILLQFWEHGVIKRKTLTAPPFALSLDAGEVKQILSGVAVLDQKRRVWTPRNSDATADRFVQQFPHVVQRQDAEWERRKTRIIRNVSNPAGAKPTMEPEARNKVVRDARADVQRWIGEQFKKQGVWSKGALTSQFKQAVKKRQGDPIPDEVYTDELKKVTMEFREGALILRKLGSDFLPLPVDRYRFAYVTFFREKPQWSGTEIGDKVAKQCGETVPHNLHHDILQELSIAKGMGADAVWTAKTGKELIAA
eukprot:Hpha_TRINITY_DN2391_c0_g1::TRINITY_DN2391_c0_g1_i1::g.467::m.467/K14721/RPC5, POLR3E; DNA-directed RNA polymerase III subunit RPC5